MQSGQDQALARRFKQAGVRVASPGGEPSYIYRWFTYPEARHLSAMGEGGYERRGEERAVGQAGVVTAWGRDWEGLAQRVEDSSERKRQASRLLR